MEETVLHLQNPDALALTNAYRSMPRNGEIDLFISLNNMGETLHFLESAGFIGIRITYMNTTSGSANITAFKAKNGPCYDTGRFVSYKGAALAVLDDDNHLLITGRKTPVCEKTANIYKLVVYEKFVSCTDPDPFLLEKLKDQPTPFNCDTFEADNEKLSQMVKGSEPGEKLVSLFYTGPFRLLVLRDGRVIHRGEVTDVPESVADVLIEKDGLFRSKVSSQVQPSNFNELYKLYGARCLLVKELIKKNSDNGILTDFESLKNASEEIKDHMLKLIKDGKKYFILTGSDKNDKLGCCPSEIVTEANRLKRAGILDSFGQETIDDSCTITIYTFKNEMQIVDNEPHFNIDNSFRQLVKDKLQNKSESKPGLFLKWILLAFIGLSLILAFIKYRGSAESISPKTLFEQLAPDTENQKVIILFHFAERCSLCINMETFTNEILNEDYLQLLIDKELKFVLLSMNDPENKNLVERFEITSAALVLVQFENKNEKRVVVLKNIWEDSQDELVFKAKLKKELEQFLSD